VQYSNTSTYYLEQVWDLNGGTSLMPNPTQYYTEPGFYQTKLIVTSPGGCTDTATKIITVYGAADSKVTYLPLDGCKPLRVDLKAQSPQKMSYVWDYGDGIIENNDDTVSQHVYYSFGDFVPKVIMTDTAGCVVPVTGKDTIRIIGVTAKFGLDQPVLCDCGKLNFTFSTTFNDPVTAYNWNFGDGTTSTQPSPSHWYAQPGNYNISLNVITENHCVDTYKLPMKVVASPAVHIGGDSVVCVGEDILHLGLFERPDTSKVRWTWQFPNGKTSSLQIPLRQVYKTAGNYTVQAIATNSSGCKDTTHQNILVNPLPSVTLPSTITTKQATPVLIPAVYSDDVKSYQWTNPDGLNCTTCPQPMATPKLNTKYKVTFVDRNGCRNTGEVQVIVLCNNDNVFVPNTFSPNGDGSNDVFYVRGKGLSRVKTLRIFNRWGEVVFERTNFNVNDASRGWDGTFKGARAIPGVYVYQVEIFCDNSQVVKFEGNVALIQ
jgi:gliding motility-associated-like protein